MVVVEPVLGKIPGNALKRPGNPCVGLLVINRLGQYVQKLPITSASPTLEKYLALVLVAKAATERPSCDELGGDFLLPVLN